MEDKRVFFIWLVCAISTFLLLPMSNLQDLDWESISKDDLDGAFSSDGIEGAIGYQLYRHGISNNYGKVFIGKDGWLYLGDRYARGMSRGRDIVKVSNKKIKSWISSMLARKHWIESQGASMVFAVAPNKHSIYPENLPNWITIQQPNSTDRLILKAQGEGLELLDLGKNILVEKDNTEYLYNRTDTHWTTKGAYVGYEGLMQGIQSQVASLKYITSEDIQFQPFTKKACCMADMLKIESNLPRDTDVEQRAVFAGLQDNICVEVIHRNGMPVETCSQVKNRRIHMNGKLNKQRVPKKISNISALNDMTVLIFRDSFATSMSRLLNATFKQSIHVHYGRVESKENFKELVKNIKPDLIIYLVVERTLFGKSMYKF